MGTQIDIGIKEADRAKIAQGLSRLLADTYTLYLKTHNFHWNVTGKMFQTLHLMFETHYNELAACPPPAPTSSSRSCRRSRRTTACPRPRT